MNGTERQSVLTDALAVRERAELLLHELTQSHQRCELMLKQSGRTDPVRTVTGRSAMERAIDETRRTLSSLDQAIESMREQIVREGEAGDGEVADLVAAVHVASGLTMRGGRFGAAVSRVGA